MPSFKIVVAYDGTDFVGWQRQATGVSIQSLLEDALRTLDEREVTVAAAGRTDAGVHALGQVAAFTLERAIDSATLVRALNAQLPDSVRALSATEVPAMFNPRFKTRAKTYRYRIWNGPVLSPFERRYAWHVFGTLDVGAMAAAARRLEGRHDFASFQAAGSDVTTTERTILSSKLFNDNHSPEKLSMNKLSTTEDAGDTEEKSFSRTTRTGTGFNLRVPRVPSGGEICGGDLICYEITGDGFLRHMVRAVAGTLVEIGRGRRPVEWIDEVLASRDRAAAGPTAPAAGLFLIAVHYGDAPCE